MTQLSERQKKILKAIIEEYIETAIPVGSETLEKKHSFGVSPATIRNEMLRLTREGYLRQSHVSAGRTPTSSGLKFYVDQLMEEEKMSVTEEVAAKEKVWDWRHDFSRLLREATKSLAEQTQYLAVSATDEGDAYHAGYSHILDIPEFYDIDVTKAVLTILDRADQLWSLMDRPSQESVNILLGGELESEFLEPCGVVFTRFETPRHRGSLGVIGPCRFNFSRVIPVVRYYGQLMREIFKDW